MVASRSPSQSAPVTTPNRQSSQTCHWRNTAKPLAFTSKPKTSQNPNR